MEKSWDYTGTVGNLDLVLPEVFKENDDYIYLGRSKNIRIYAVVAFPAILHIGFFDELYRYLKENISSVTYIKMINDKEACDKLTEEIAKATSNANVSTNEYAKLSKKAEDFRETRDNIQLGRDKLFSIVRLYRLWGKTKEELEHNCDEFESLCEQKGIIVKCLALRQKHAFRSLMPTIHMELNESKFKKNVNSGGFATLLSEGNSGITHKSGIYLGRVKSTNAKIFFDNFIGPPFLSNPMMMIFGIPGSGKSALLKTICSRSNVMGDWDVYFDIEGEGKSLIDKQGGTYIDLKAGVKTGINPFDLEVTEDEKGNKYVDIFSKISSIREMLAVFSEKFRGKGLLGNELTIIESCIRKLYEDRGINENPESLFEYTDIAENETIFNVGKKKKRIFILSDLKKELEGYPGTTEFAELMGLITGNGSLSLFDCETTVDLKKGLTGVGFKNIRDGYMKFFAIINMMEWVWTVFGDYKYKKIRKRLIIDEAWYVLRHLVIAQFIEEIERRGRKYRSQLVLATHFLNDLLKTEEGKAILKMAATKVVMQQNVDSCDEVAEYLKLSDALKDEMKMFEPGDAILIYGNEKIRMKTHIFSFEEEFAYT